MSALRIEPSKGTSSKPESRCEDDSVTRAASYDELEGA
jgi:hypothetical protein